MFKSLRKPEVVVTINRGSENEQQIGFSESFRIGRGNQCEIQLTDSVVSVHHVEVLRENGTWWIHDVHSTNGTFLDGQLIHKAKLSDRATIQLGKRGPIVSFKLTQPELDRPVSALPAPTLFGTILRALPSSTQAFQRYFSRATPENAGQYTVYLRQALQEAVRKRSRKFLLFTAIVSIIAAGAFAMIWLQHRRLAALEPLGIDIFYSMKNLELQISQLAETLGNSDDAELSHKLDLLRQKHRQMQTEYDRFVARLGIYDQGDEQERLILQIARIFGECEIAAPEGFVDEVKKFIKKWQATDRLERAVRKSIAYGYPKTVAEAFLANQLPPHFLYLALQESDFDVNSIGPKTRYGIAKGMWQFMPRIAQAYGLRVGPLRTYRRVDPRDERHDFEKSTRAAAKMIRDL